MDDRKFQTITELISITDLCTTLGKKLANISASSLTPEMKQISPDFEIKIGIGQYQADQLKKAVRDIIKLFTAVGGDYENLCLPMIKALSEGAGGAGGVGTFQSLPPNDLVMSDPLPILPDLEGRIRLASNLNKRSRIDMSQGNDDETKGTKKLKTGKQEGKVSVNLFEAKFRSEIVPPTETHVSSAKKVSDNLFEAKFRSHILPPTEIDVSSAKIVSDNLFEADFTSEIVPPTDIDVCLDGISALEDTKSIIQALVISPIKWPELFMSGLLQPCKGLLLFGPPGTGKTTLAKAIARECGANLINFSCSSYARLRWKDIELKTKALFKLAAKVAPTVIFVDDVDKMLGKKQVQKIKRDFLSLWDRVRDKAKESKEHIIVLGATSRPFDLDDEAIIKRFRRRIFVDLPDERRRESILRAFLAEESVQDIYFEEIAAVTEGYSARDLKELCAAASYQPLAELKQESSASVVHNEITSEESILRPLNMDDLKQARKRVLPRSMDGSSRKECNRWNDLYGF